MKPVSRLAIALLLVLSFCVGTVAHADGSVSSVGQADQQTTCDAAIAWLKSQQLDDGSFPSDFGAYGVTLDSALAGAVSGEDLDTWRTAPENASVLEYLTANAGAAATTAGTLGKLANVIVASGRDPSDVGGLDLGSEILGLTDAQGAIGASVNDQAWGTLGLAAMRISIPAEAIAFLIAQQDADGGWDSGFGIDSNTSAIALQALAAAGVVADGAAVTDGLAYMATQQAASGGFVFSSAWGTTSDPSSTAYGIQALIALGENPFDAAWLQSGDTSLDDLLGMQLQDGGFPGYLGTSDLMTTAQAIPGVLGRPMPLLGRVPARVDALAYLKGIQTEAGAVAGANSDRALIAIAAADDDPYAWMTSESSLVSYVEDMAPSAQIVGDMGRVALGLAIAGGNPYYAAGRNLVADIQAEADPVTGALDDAGSLYSEMLGIQALIASNAVLPAGTVDNLLAAQNEDGGWGWAVGQDSDSNTAALAVQTLIAAGVPGNDDVIVSAAVYLQSVQGSDGGFVYSPVWGDISDADSTGVALQAFQSLGVDTSAGWSFARTLQGADVISTTLTKPEQFLYGLQNADGSFNWQPGVPGFGEMSTLDALASLGDGPYVEPSASLASAHDAVAWLKTQQLADGSFPVGWGHAGGVSLDVLFAGLAMGEEAGDWAVSVGDVTLIDYLSASAPEYATTAGAAGKLLCGAVAAGVDPRAFDETDLVATVRSFETTTGAFGDSLADQAWAMLGLAASGVPICPEALDQMAFAQNEDGGWGWMPGEDSDTNSTSMAIQALIAGGMARDNAEMVDALAFLAAQQLPDGGFPFMPGGAIDAASTGYVLQALIAVGESPFSEPWLVDGSSPADALLALQLQEGAYPGWAGTADLMSTAQSVPGLLLETLPLRVGLYSVAQWLPFTSTAVAQ